MTGKMEVEAGVSTESIQNPPSPIFDRANQLESKLFGWFLCDGNIDR